MTSQQNKNLQQISHFEYLVVALYTKKIVIQYENQ